MNEKKEKQTKQNNKNSNTIFIGTKPFMKYINSVIMQFKAKNMDFVIIKARGKSINRAVDVAESVRKKFLKDKNLEVKDIKINSEEFDNKEGKKRSVSAIEITLKKKQF